jgi:hypothetical protein
MSPGEASVRRPARAFHPLLFALFPLLSLYRHNLQQIAPEEIVRPLVLVLAALVPLWLLLTAACRDGRRAGIVLSVLVVFFFAYGHLLTGMTTHVPEVAALGEPEHVLGLVWFGALLGLLAVVLRTRRDLDRITGQLNVTALVAVTLPLAGIASGLFRANAARASGAAAAAAASPVDPPHQRAAGKAVADKRGAPPPDIYYILLDGYGRADRLREMFGYDNGPFLGELERRGFFVADRSRANYCQTKLAMAATLNMTYLDDLARKEGKNSSGDAALREMTRRNRVARFLEDRGYRYVRLTDEDLAVERDKDVGTLLAGRFRMTSFEGLLLQITPLSFWLPVTQESMYEQHRRRLLGILDRVVETAAAPSAGAAAPKFVYAHVLAPHPPFVFGRNGEPIDPRAPFDLADASHYRRWGRDRDEYRRRYPDQLAFISRRVLAVVDEIFARSARPPVVILQGDHGARMTLNWEDIRRSGLRDSFANLNAVYLPDGAAKAVYPPHMSNVNTFRLLFNHLFGAGLAPLPDRSFYSGALSPFDFTDVTDRTGDAEPAP